jgi:hypothetical protein
LTALYVLSSDLVADRVAMVLVAKAFDLLVLWVDEESSEAVMSVLFELLEDSANCDDLSREAASWAC